MKAWSNIEISPLDPEIIKINNLAAIYLGNKRMVE